MRLKVLTYNIHKGIGGVDRKYSLERIIEVIQHYSPDVALLQEVDDGVPRSRRHRQVDLLAERLGFAHTAFQPNVKLRQGKYGNAILSHVSIRDVVDVDLTVGPKKRRRAQVARLHVEEHGHSRTVVVANLHLGLAGFERRMQLKRLFEETAVSRTHAETPMIVGGDFNDVWGSLGATMMTPRGLESATRHARTFPAALPLRALDAIYFRGEINLDHAYPGHLKLAKQASDHLPLVAEFEVPFR
ncbi:endonuclease/exonuclease/phosphatase family protein [Planctomycetota bacterium]